MRRKKNRNGPTIVQGPGKKLFKNIRNQFGVVVFLAFFAGNLRVFPRPWWTPTPASHNCEVHLCAVYSAHYINLGDCISSIRVNLIMAYNLYQNYWEGVIRVIITEWCSKGLLCSHIVLIMHRKCWLPISLQIDEKLQCFNDCNKPVGKHSSYIMVCSNSS